MRGVCFEAIERVGLRDLPDPVIEQATDAIVRVELAGLCGSDLHPFFGRERGIDVGTVMGHEFVGEVVATGSAVTSVKIGDRVAAPFTTNCGTCDACLSGLTSRCRNGQLFGWKTGGRGLDGGQAEFVRVPLADGTLMRVPTEISNDAALLIGDNLSTAQFAVDLAGVIEGGTYVVIGCGTVGLLTVATALQTPGISLFAIDLHESRRKLAERLGATVFADGESAAEAIADRTDGRGADAVLELVGLPQAQRLAYRLVRSGGTLSVIGCHCTPHFAFSPAEAYDKNLTYRTGRCPARAYMPRLSDRLAAEPIDLSWCVTHRFSLDQAEQAYQIFAHAEQGCVKAVLER